MNRRVHLICHALPCAYRPGLAVRAAGGRPLPSLGIRENVVMKPYEIRTFRVDMAGRAMRPSPLDEG